MSKPLLLLFGLGPRTGTPIAAAFTAAGYNVAGVSRSTPSTPPPYLHIPADVTDPTAVSTVFAKTRAHFNKPPNVVIYNAAPLIPPPDSTNPFSIPAAEFQQTLNGNIASLYTAAGEAVKGFAELEGEGEGKTFIFVGNKQSHGLIIPGMVSLGAGKAAASYIMASGADTLGKKRGFNFYYADQRMDTGAAVYANIDGEAHGAFFLELAGRKAQGPWEATFVKGKGYVKFPKLVEL